MAALDQRFLANLARISPRLSAWVQSATGAEKIASAVADRQRHKR